MRANLGTLIGTARQNPDRTVTASSWTATAQESGHVTVWHYRTPMFTVNPRGEVLPINAGWGSQSDRCGVSRILAGAGIHTTYRALYGV